MHEVDAEEAFGRAILEQEGTLTESEKLFESALDDDRARFEECELSFSLSESDDDEDFDTDDDDGDDFGETQGEARLPPPDPSPTEADADLPPREHHRPGTTARQTTRRSGGAEASAPRAAHLPRPRGVRRGLVLPVQAPVRPQPGGGLAPEERGGHGCYRFLRQTLCQGAEEAPHPPRALRHALQQVGPKHPLPPPSLSLNFQ